MGKKHLKPDYFQLFKKIQVNSMWKHFENYSVPEILNDAMLGSVQCMYY